MGQIWRKKFKFTILERTHNLEEKEYFYAKKYGAWEEGYNIAPLLNYYALDQDDINKNKALLIDLLTSKKTAKYLLTSIADKLELSIEQTVLVIKNISKDEMIFHKFYFRLRIDYSYYEEHAHIDFMDWGNYLEFQEQIKKAYTQI